MSQLAFPARFDPNAPRPGPRRPAPSVIPRAEPSLVTGDPRLRECLRILETVAPSDAAVLLQGESGTGKEILARALHESSPRRNAPFVAVNCGAIAESLQEAALFGHTAGAFTGAVRRGIGHVEAANGGTLFLDEIGDMRPSLQGHLLRVLQAREYTPVGAAHPVSCDVRVVAACRTDLAQLVREQRFREDLYYRINVISLEVPPLRERAGDVALLLDHFLAKFAPNGTPPRVAPAVREALLEHDYPGNVRELENLVRRCVLLCGGALVTLEHLPAPLRERPRHPAVHAEARDFHAAKSEAIAAFELNYLSRALREAGGIVSRAARRCGLSERNFHAKLRQYRLDARSFRA